MPQTEDVIAMIEKLVVLKKVDCMKQSGALPATGLFSSVVFSLIWGLENYL
jgi:hypothetical protein